MSLKMTQETLCSRNEGKGPGSQGHRINNAVDLSKGDNHQGSVPTAKERKPSKENLEESSGTNIIKFINLQIIQLLAEFRRICMSLHISPAYINGIVIRVSVRGHGRIIELRYQRRCKKNK